MLGQSSGAWLNGGGDLNRRFMVYLPSKTKDGKDIHGLDRISDTVANLLRVRFGGATRYPATGYFGEQKEEIVVIESYCSDEDWNASSDYFRGLMKALGTMLSQDAIACSLDGKMALVEPGAEEFGIEQILKESLASPA